jgi:hypothetical protein
MAMVTPLMGVWYYVRAYVIEPELVERRQQKKNALDEAKEARAAAAAAATAAASLPEPAVPALPVLTADVHGAASVAAPQSAESAGEVAPPEPNPADAVIVGSLLTRKWFYFF